MASTHAELAARLLRDAAVFFTTIGEQNPPLRDQMLENADVFRQVARLVEDDPTGALLEDGETSGDESAGSEFNSQSLGE